MLEASYASMFRPAGGPGPSGLTARVEELRDREEEIVASRARLHRNSKEQRL